MKLETTMGAVNENSSRISLSADCALVVWLTTSDLAKGNPAAVQLMGPVVLLSSFSQISQSSHSASSISHAVEFKQQVEELVKELVVEFELSKATVAQGSVVQHHAIISGTSTWVRYPPCRRFHDGRYLRSSPARYPELRFSSRAGV